MSINGKTVGLALSGGGYRATLFGLGTLWRLNDAGVLGHVDHITSVSGGSILCGVLAHGWARLDFADGKAGNFGSVVVKPVQDFCHQTIDVGVALRGLLNPFRTAGEVLADRYATDLFGATTLKDLPAAGTGVPTFTFYATNLQTGRSFRFEQGRVCDYMIGEARQLVVPLALAVAASSAFPPLFSPVILKASQADWTDTDLTVPDAPQMRERVVLADGGIYDNMGLERLVGASSEAVDVVLVSDAGAPFEVEVAPHEDDLRQLGRVRDILIDQTRALRKRWLMSELAAGRRLGAYWGITTAIDSYAASAPMAADTDLTRALAHVPTRLSAMDEPAQARLINWGYALCDAALRTHARMPVPAAGHLPLPAFPLH